MFGNSFASLLESFENPKIREGLAEVRELFDQGRTFDALKVLRPLFAIEDAILAEEGRSDKPGNQQQIGVA
jgi:flagellar biosynthesis regulator FlbT